MAGFCLDSFNDTSDRAFKVSDDGVGVVEMLDDIVDLWDMQVGHLEDDVSSSRFFEPFWQRDYIEQVRPYAKKPIAAVGRFTDPELMARAVGDGVIDIIGAARPAISDPFIPTKIQEGRAEDIRECIGCNMCVSRFNNGGGRIVCTQNATVGEEYRRGWHPEKFNPSDRAEDPVLIIGAGPAGMECARVLGERGFEAVHLAEADAGDRRPRQLGVAAARDCVRGDEWSSTAKRSWRRCRTSPSSPASTSTVEDVLDYGASTVVIATGASWDRTGTSPLTHVPVPGADAHPTMVFTPEDVMLEKRAVDGDRVLVYDCDGYFMGSSLAQKLAIEGQEGHPRHPRRPGRFLPVPHRRRRARDARVARSRRRARDRVTCSARHRAGDGHRAQRLPLGQGDQLVRRRRRASHAASVPQSISTSS